MSADKKNGGGYVRPFRIILFSSKVFLRIPCLNLENPCLKAHCHPRISYAIESSFHKFTLKMLVEVSKFLFI